MYGSFSELEAMGVDPNQLLGLISNEKEEEEKNRFLIVDEQDQEDEGIL